MGALPKARLCHLSAGRLRLRIPEKRHDLGFFDTVRRRLAAWDSIETIEVNPLTASVLIRFSNPAALFAESAAKNDLFEVSREELTAAAEPPRKLTDQAVDAITRGDAAIRRWTAGTADIRTAVFVGLLGGAVLQVYRGSIAAPAATLLWYAADVLWRWDK